MEQKDQSSYRQIMKATTIFGGVQVFNIFISIIRSKVIALLLGPAGMGVSSLLTSTTSLVSSLTNLGLGTSAVKNVAEAYATNETVIISRIVSILRRWMWITGILGGCVMVIGAPFFSELNFGNRNYIFAFICLSLMVLFTQLTVGQNVLLQGTRKLKYLAKASLLGGISGLIVSFPLYYFFEIKGIVPALILTSLITFMCARYFAHKVKIPSVKLAFRSVLMEGHGMVVMGILLSLSGLISLLVSYIVRIYIAKTGSVEQVGLYDAGFAIVNTYVGMIFTAMATDYYPRLAGVSKDNYLSKTMINQQIEVAILIIAPILMIFFVFSKWGVILFYSEKFIDVTGMIQWAALGMFFKTVSWAISFLFLAKGASKLFFMNELVTNVYILILNILGYKYGGLDGIGMAFFAGFVLYSIQVYTVCYLKYSFSLELAFIRYFGIQLCFGILCFIIMGTEIRWYSYCIGSVFILISTLYSLKRLNKLLDIKDIFNRVKYRFHE